MAPETAMKRLSIFMVFLGAALILTIPFAFEVWPAGFRWGHPHGHAPYERMIISIYVSLGICMIVASRDPLKNAIIIDFAILSSILHGGVMTYDSFAQDGELMHMLGDVPLLFAVAALLWFYHPRRLVRGDGPGSTRTTTD
ncbi:MAG: hypothetical protein GY946_16975 [bacterium]|nr:hypothetical protein [bacterium]